MLAGGEIQNVVVESAPGSSTPGCEPDCFIPSTVTIDNGETVRFTNSDNSVTYIHIWNTS